MQFQVGDIVEIIEFRCRKTSIEKITNLSSNNPDYPKWIETINLNSGNTDSFPSDTSEQANIGIKSIRILNDLERAEFFLSH